MTRLYDAYTNQEIKTFHTVAGFAVRQGDVLNIDGVQFKVKTIEHMFETRGHAIVYIERKIYVTQRNGHVLH